MPRPRDPSSLADVERELTRLLRRSRATSSAMATAVHPELDVPSYVVLVAVRDLGESRPGGVRASDVGESLGLHKSTMSRTIAVLESLGLLERVPDPEDARARLLTLTAGGTASLDHAVRARRARIAETLGRWNAADLRELSRLLGKLNDDFS